MALRTHFNQSEIGCPRIAEFTVQRTEALFDHITGLRQISVAFGLHFRQRMVAVGFAHNAVQQLMFFQMLPVFLTVIAFVGIDGRAFGNALQQRRQVFALMGIGGGNVQFLNIAFRRYGYVVCTRVCRGRFSLSSGHRCLYSVWFVR